LAFWPSCSSQCANAHERLACAGPWAREVAFNHGSYLFNFGALVETNVTDWIAMARSLGVTVRGLSFHVGSQVAEPKKYVEAIGVCAELIEHASASGHATPAASRWQGPTDRQVREPPAAR
jgi:hypothetical protein